MDATRATKQRFVVARWLAFSGTFAAQEVVQARRNVARLPVESRGLASNFG
jgi:hypothetical protein